MLAPRNKLWSTPVEVIEEAIKLLEITPEDTVYDIGCGDGRFLFSCAELTNANVIGVEINEERVEEIRVAIKSKNLERCNVICENALNLSYVDATVVFLYLIPRGLRLILPILLAIPHKVRIVTYMTPFPGDMISMKGSEKVVVHVGDQVVQYPLYFYETSPEAYSDSATSPRDFQGAS